MIRMCLSRGNMRSFARVVNWIPAEQVTDVIGVEQALRFARESGGGV